jgi:hypothetical protein
VALVGLGWRAGLVPVPVPKLPREPMLVGEGLPGLPGMPPPPTVSVLVAVELEDVPLPPLPVQGSAGRLPPLGHATCLNE